jgi:hypothetical protein
MMYRFDYPRGKDKETGRGEAGRSEARRQAGGCSSLDVKIGFAREKEEKAGAKIRG